MKNYLLKMSHSGGDADIDYEGFIILNQPQLDAFNDILSVICKEREEIHLHVDCDDLLPSVFRSKDSWSRKFEDVFTVSDLSESESSALIELFGYSYGITAAFTYVWDSDEFYAKYKDLHSFGC
ncbi:MAG: hypothetical protein EBT92_17900 [Planctomycetes bacterium]|nr:hypothetical protein [Planctomycetota bacterium]